MPAFFDFFPPNGRCFSAHLPEAVFYFHYQSGRKHPRRGSLPPDHRHRHQGRGAGTRRHLQHHARGLERSFERERQFTSDTSHELRTPVAVISACAEELEAGLSAGEAAQSLAAIRRESARMNKIISQLLMLTRGYEGRIHLEKETLEFRNLVGSVMEELSESAAASEIRLLNQVPQGCTIFADQSLLTQLLINLIGNSIKYGMMGGKVTVRATASETGCTFTVSDNGIGMQPEELDHIFERFYRADKARDRSGFGLGMPIVKWIVELHGGDIRVASEAGKGTQVTVTV